MGGRKSTISALNGVQATEEKYKVKFAITYCSGDVAKKIPLVITNQSFEYERHLEFESKEGFKGCIYLNDCFYVAEYNRVMKFNKDLKLEQMVQVGIDNHALTYHDGNLYVVSTGEGIIYQLDFYTLVPKGKILHETVMGEFIGSGSHINSVSYIGEYPVITVHNKDREGYVYMSSFPIGWDKGWKNNIVIARNLYQPHDFYPLEDGYLINNSLVKQVVCCRVPIERSWSQLVMEYTRGLEVYGKNVYVGCSGRNHRHSYVIQLDLETGRIKEQYELPERFGVEIYSIVKIFDD